MIRLDLKIPLRGADGPFTLDVKHEIPKGQLVTLYGKSGAGKTTVLRLMAGLVMPESGYIEVEGDVWLDTKKGLFKKPQHRSLGLVFQDFALFPNMTVGENMRFALSKDQPHHIVSELADVFEMGDLMSRKPKTLSGGQQQRVALARALVSRPHLLLLDEPLSALDHAMRQKLQEYLLKVHKKYQLTTFLVSHDVGEIYKLSDHVLQMEGGKIAKSGSPIDLFSGRQLSGKFQFTGEVLQVIPEDVIFVVSVLIDNHLVKVIVDEQTAASLSVGDKVLVASKAFNPVIQRI